MAEEGTAGPHTIVELPSELAEAAVDDQLLLAAMNAQLVEAVAMLAQRQQECEHMGRELHAYASAFERMHQQQAGREPGARCHISSRSSELRASLPPPFLPLFRPLLPSKSCISPPLPSPSSLVHSPSSLLPPPSSLLPPSSTRLLNPDPGLWTLT